MNPSHSPTVVIVPGLRDHVADHWQTLLAERLSDVRTVPPLERDKLSRAARVAALDDVLREIDGPVVLVAHSAGVMITVHWAQNPTRPIQGALLATPADLELPLPEGYPTTDDLDRGGWNPIPRRRLPFPSIVAASRTDPLGGYRRIAGMAETWGSRLVDLGDVGHLNPAAGYGYWPDAENLLRQLLDSTALPVHS
ncbi:alpha/beta hydrolase [Rhodococcus ruber]|uniref:Alpha/beta hydrolase n=1 Tax=Rhodococcus indonesiensis TaxID=3055869 RepID=A0ABT7RSF1_9NOCA|nr:MULTISPECIES: alpha/beta fold hydrolase [Rhodococcus]RIK01977.1 MAG: serine hydrolase family protein [Acidobacteriota bacterium]ATQ27745.1 serine hydrolase family protein [Rhodococcus ruber]AUM15285.1 serine hydrolase family protein [Rhodococcus ruber]AXY52179.1 alpha/beta hydrolase [Rhodococcus ruber]MBD8052785.1 serine hydrolase family protein [Rhodococcus ruber]